MAVSLAISRNGGSYQTVDLPASDTPISFKYQLESEDLSAYTSAYSTSVSLPHTHVNDRVLNHPLDTGYGAVNTPDTFTYTYDVDSFHDYGKVVISSVNDESININLFSSIAQFASWLSSQEWATTYKKSDGTDSDVVPTDKFWPGLHAFYLNGTGTYPSFNTGITSAGHSTDGLLGYGVADFGCPSANDFNSSLFGIYRHDEGMQLQWTGPETPLMQAPLCAPSYRSETTPRQVRFYQLRLVMPVTAVLHNIGDRTYTISTSSDALSQLNNHWYVGPSVSDIIDDNEAFLASDFFSHIEKPGEILLKVLKHLNLRIIPVNETEIKIVTTREFYSTTVTNLSSLIDYSTYEVQPHAYKYNTILFEDESLDSAWLSGYKDSTGYDFTSASVTTNYPVTSSKEWFGSNKLKSGISLSGKTSPIIGFNSDGEPVYAKDISYGPILQAYDSDVAEIDISGCLVSNPHGSGSFNVFRDDYSGDSKFKGWYIFNNLSYQETIDDLCIAQPGNIALYFVNFSYGNPKYLPADTTITPAVYSMFPDVVDSLTSSLVTTNVCFAANTSIDSIVRGLYHFENNNWVVWEISGYNPVSNEPSCVTFLKVNDLTKYQPSTATHSNTVSVSHGSYTALVNGVSVSSPFTTHDGDTVSVVFTPSSGYHFDHCTVNGTTYTTAQISYISTADVTVEGTCEPGLLVTASASSHGSVTPTSVTVTSGSSLTLVATPDSGYRVYQWTDNGTTITSSSNSYYLSNITVSHTVSVSFVSSACQLTVQSFDAVSLTSDAGGKISTDGTTWAYHMNISGTYGDTITIYTRPDSGYRWDHWSDTSGGYISAQEVYTYTFNDAADSMRALFWPTGTSSYSLVTTSGAGVTNTRGFGNYAAGTSVTVDCDLEDGYSFDGWYSNDTKVSSSQSYTFTMPSNNLTLQARGTSSGKVVLNFRCTNGTVTPTRSELDPGQTVSVSVSPSTGYVFEQWSDGSTDNPRVFTAVSSYTYTAVCSVPRQYTLTFVCEEGGDLDETSFTGYTGSSIDVECKPHNNFSFTQWDDGSTVNPRTFVITNKSESFKAICTKTASTLNFTTDTPAHSSCTPAQSTENIGTEVTVTVTTDAHYYFSRWNDGNVDNPRVFTHPYNDETYTAEVNQETQWTLSFSSNDTSLGTVSQSSYSGYNGDTVTVSASPTAGYNIFSSWNDGDHSNPRTFTVGSMDRQYQAIFYRLQTYHVSLTCAQSGVTLTGSGDYLAGASVTVKCENYTGSFLYWADVHTGSALAYTAEYTFTMPSSALDLVAVIS